MKLVDLKDLSAEHLRAFGAPRELTPEEQAEAVRLIEADLAVQDLDHPAAWAPATPMEDLLLELEEEQKRWDEQHP